MVLKEDYMSYLGMYILTKLDSWQCFSKGAGSMLLVAAGIMSLGCAMACSDNYGTFVEDTKKLLKAIHVKTVLISSVVLLVLSQLLPTTKQAAFIYIAPQIIENGAVKDTVKNIPELTKLGTDYLKELLKEKVNDIKG